jgi:hypothetical protein
MRNFRVIRAAVAALSVAFLQLGHANAGQIVTPILLLSNNTNQVLCIASNIGPAITVNVTIINVLGGSTHQSCSLAANDPGGCQVPLFSAGQCRIGVSGLTDDQVRARIRGVMFTRSTFAPFAIEAVVQAN